jgi:glucose/arabinose dehydrogenase
MAATAPSALPRPQGTVVAGFTESLVTTQVSTPTALAAVPDGRVIVLQKSGAVRVLQNGVPLPGSALSLTVCTQSERGLLGVALDPEFNTNGRLFLYYTRPSAAAPGGCVNRVSRFEMNGNTIDPASEVVLLDNIGSPAGNHNGGDLEVGNDGFLYVGVGDGGSDPRANSGSAGANDAAQDRSLLNGKILRIDRNTGAPAPGNPYTGAGTDVCATRGNTPATPTTICQEIFAYGLRNPWRFAFDPNTGATRFYINDVGQNAVEEVDLGILGANYGYPAREGRCAQGTPYSLICPPPDPSLGYTQPITDYPHNPTNGGDYITGGAFVPNGAWSSTYDGGYLYSDGDPGKIFFRNAAGNTNYNVPFVTGVGGITDIGFVMEPAGWALYTVNAATSEVRKVVYNTAPAASPGTLSYTPSSPAERAFDSRNSGANSGPLRAATSRLVNVAATQGNHRAALVNLTFLPTASDGFLTAWQPRTTLPPSSNINSQGGQAAANSSVVPVDADGNVMVFSSVRADVIVDVIGFFDVAAGGVATAGRFTPSTPVRAADTRVPATASNIYTSAPAGAETVVNVPIAGHYGITSANTSVAVIVTAIARPDAVGGYAVVKPHGGAEPPSSNVNVNGFGDVRANLVVVPLGADGSIDIRLHEVVYVLVDVVGSFTDATAPSSASGTYVSLAPTRIADTRSSIPFGRPTAGATVSINPSAVPDGALGVTQNIIMVGADGYGYVTAFPAGLVPLPVVSNGNTTAPGQIRSVLSMTVLGSGSSSYYVSIGTDLVVDVTGYFQGSGAG